MDTIANLKAFLAVARTESFAAAARELGVAASVVTKRISQLEWRLKASLFERTTRHVSLTPTGQAYLPAVQRLVADAEDLFAQAASSRGALQGQMRIKAPTSVAVRLVGPILERFQQQYPLLNLEVMALDRPVNPAEEGFDLALTLLPDTYAGVIETALCPMPRSVCATPAYLERHGQPAHPRDLKRHAILNFLPTGDTWRFGGPAGEIRIKLQPRMNTNEAQLLLSAALAGNGIALLSAYLSGPAVQAGDLVPVLQEYPIQALWLKALVPENRAKVPRVQALLRYLMAELGEVGSSDQLG